LGISLLSLADAMALDQGFSRFIWLLLSLSHHLSIAMGDPAMTRQHIAKFQAPHHRWLRYYSTNRKVAGSIPNEVIFFFLTYLILPAALGPGVYSASNRNEYQKNDVTGE
jgi:hypothetical protein